MKALLVGIATFFLASSSVLGSDCKDLYPSATPIVVPNTVELCNSFFVSVFDRSRNAVVFVSERLKKGSAVGIATRANNFRSDPRLGFKSPKNSQYLKTGYDRGHMAPADDASNEAEMSDTFLLTNMTPQVPSLNRISWKKLEGTVRKIFNAANGDVYVLTIAEYADKKKTMNGIPVPTGYWKVVITPSEKMFFYAENAINAKVVKKRGTSVAAILSAQ